MDDTLKRLEAVAAKLERAAAKMGGGAAVEEGVTPQYVTDYEEMMKNELEAFCEACTKVPDFYKTDDCLNAIRAAFASICDLLKMTTVAKKPSVQDIVTFLAPVSESIKVINKLAGARKNKAITQYKALCELVMMNTWPTMYPPNGLPAGHCKGQYESADFHYNRILMKEKTDENVVFVKAARALMKKNEELVKENFKTGVDFVGKGDLGSAEAPKAAAPEKKAAPKKAVKKADDGAAKANALLGDLQKGVGKEGDASMASAYGLKKVKKSQKNKYKKEKTVGKVTMTARKAKAKKELPPAKMSKRGPFNWFFENYSDKEGVVNINEDTPPGNGKITMKQGLYFANCYNAMFVVETKVKSVTLDGCHRCKIQTADVVSAIEMVNCKGVTVYCKGKVPALSIDKAESPLIVFLKEAVTDGVPQVTVSSVVAGNIEIPGKTDDDDPQQFPIPEQFEIKINKDTRELVCETMKHEG